MHFLSFTGFCAEGHARCSSSVDTCFIPQTERCDNKFDCPLGEDEVSCGEHDSSIKLKFQKIK